MLECVGQAASEDELRLALGLAGYTTGKGKADLKDSNIRPIEVFMCSVVRALSSAISHKAPWQRLSLEVHGAEGSSCPAPFLSTVWQASFRPRSAWVLA